MVEGDAQLSLRFSTFTTASTTNCLRRSHRNVYVHVSHEHCEHIYIYTYHAEGTKNVWACVRATENVIYVRINGLNALAV